MSATFTRTLTFKSRDLGVDATLLLTFDKLSEGMYHDQFPLCWKVIPFPSTGSFKATAIYQNKLAFFRSQIDPASDTVVPVDASTYQPIDVGQKTTLFQDDNGDYKFTAPEADLGNNIKGFNGSAQEETMGVGFLTKDHSVPTPLFVFPGVRTGSFVQAQFTPVLRAYITYDYQETQIIRSEVDTPLLWARDLVALSDDTVWAINYDTASGVFSIQFVEEEPVAAIGAETMYS